MRKVCVFDSRAPAPGTGNDVETGIDGLRRGVRWSRVREGSGGGGHAAVVAALTKWHGVSMLGWILYVGWR